MKNNKTYWLMGGIIGGIVYLLFGIGLIPIPFVGWILYTPLLFIPFLYGSSIILPAGIILGFVLGSLLGWIYGKVNNNS